MTKILLVTASPKGTASSSRRLAELVITRIKATHPALAKAELIHRDLTQTDLPFVNVDWMTAAYAPPEAWGNGAQTMRTLSDGLVDELLSVDAVVIATPMYNFTVPAVLKAWVDQIARAGRTFAFTEAGPKGLVEGKPFYVAWSSGTDFSQPSVAPLNHLEPYLRTVLGFIGVTDLSFFNVNGFNDELLNKSLEKAALRIAS